MLGEYYTKTVINFTILETGISIYMFFHIDYQGLYRGL